MTDLNSLLEIALTVRSKITITSEVLLAGYNSAEELIAELDKDIQMLKAGDKSALKNFYLKFLPTSTFQEVALANGWSDEYNSLAGKFDKLYEKVMIAGK